MVFTVDANGVPISMPFVTPQGGEPKTGPASSTLDIAAIGREALAQYQPWYNPGGERGIVGYVTGRAKDTVTGQDVPQITAPEQFVGQMNATGTAPPGYVWQLGSDNAVHLALGQSEGEFRAGQQAAMAGNRWLLTTPGGGIGTQTREQPSAIRWPGTKSPGKAGPTGTTFNPETRRWEPTAQRAGSARQQGSTTATAAPRQVAGPRSPHTTVITPEAQRGLFPGPRAPAQVSFSPPGVQASADLYNYTPTADGSFQVAVPGISADPLGIQYSSTFHQPPSAAEMLGAQSQYAASSLERV